MLMAHTEHGLTLALGGGGARGFAHVGVLQVLEEHGVKAASVVGVSAGAVAGAGYALGFSTAEMRERVQEFGQSPLARDSRLLAMMGSAGSYKCKSLSDRLSRLFSQGMLVKSFFLDTSLLSEDFFHDMVAFFLPKVNLEDTAIPFAAVATDIKTGEPVVLEHGDLRRAVQASCAVPGVAAPVEIDGRWLIDGGASILVPTPVARQRSAGPLLAVSVDRDIVTEDLPGQSLEFYLRATEIQGHHLVQLLLEQADLALRPSLGDVHWADFGKSAWIMDQGYHAASQAWERLEALLRPGPWWRRFFSREAAVL
ncbi:MAG: patatin-like phospholipase family protein [Thermodesulfobacteriota bacterium]